MLPLVSLGFFGPWVSVVGGFCRFFFAFASFFCFGILFVYFLYAYGRLMLFYDIPLITYPKKKKIVTFGFIYYKKSCSCS
jgi:hypothetical protein